MTIFTYCNLLNMPHIFASFKLIKELFGFVK